MHSLSERQQKTFYYALAGMLCLHAAFMVVKFSGDFSTRRTHVVEKNDAIKITFLPEMGKAVEQINKKQIVQSEDSASKDKPKDAAFLSDKDRSFDRETIARNVDTFKRTALGNAAATQEASKAKKAEKSVAESKSPVMKDLKLSDFGMPVEMKPVKEASRAPASATKSGISNGDPLSNGFSSTNDYVQEVALGDFTHLNTVEFKFYGFYHRIRQKLEQFWGKSIQEKSHALFRSGRRLPAGEDLITSVRITMNAKGEIVGVKILGTSGVKELDDAAVESFNQAGPFPNPPKELLVDGKATIEWGFVVKS